MSIFTHSDHCAAGVDADDPNAVVVGLAPSQFHYNRLNEAFRSASAFLCVYCIQYSVIEKFTPNTFTLLVTG